MRQNDETTAHQLYYLLEREGYYISLSTILKCRTSLGWIFQGSAYCQLIRDADKVLRYNWVLQSLNDHFKMSYILTSPASKWSHTKGTIVGNKVKHQKPNPNIH